MSEFNGLVWRKGQFVSKKKKEKEKRNDDCCSTYFVANGYFLVTFAYLGPLSSRRSYLMLF